MLPRGWDRRSTVFLTFALLSVISTNISRAQVFDLDRDRVPMAELNGLMRFHTGDDPHWANPNFDDSSWSLLRADQSWFDQGYKGYSGFGWYRFEVNLPERHGALALYIPHIWAVYQVYANGRLIGEVGRMPPQERVIESHWLLFPIPESLIAQERQLTFAIRVWNRPYESSFQGGGPDGALRIGDLGTLSDWRSLQIKRVFWSGAFGIVLISLNLLFAFGAAALFLLRPAEREYLWWGIMELSFTVSAAIGADSVFHPAWISRTGILFSCLLALNQLSSVFLVRALLKDRFGLIYWLAAGSSLWAGAVGVADQLEWVSRSNILVLYQVATLPTDIFITFAILRGARRGNQDARLLLIPQILWDTLRYGDQMLRLVEILGHKGFPLFRAKLEQSSDWPFPVNAIDAAGFLWYLSIAVIVLFRFVRTSREEERHASEIDAARTVQQVLIPQEIPAIPGLAFECVYKPAGQVGGDFFQILPTPTSGALIIIGDVSGKGMPAAMAVSLLVGTVRTLAHFTQSPGEIITAMNQRMLGRSKDGFTTCLVLRLGPDGAATVASAGHLAPYLGCTEVPVESGLPLGLAAQAEYTESSFHLDIGDELTLVTDGIAEARATTGELFGFERTASIAVLSAEHIAATAVAFGQQDDITVLKIRRQPAPEPAQLPVASHTLTPSAA